MKDLGNNNNNTYNSNHDETLQLPYSFHNKHYNLVININKTNRNPIITYKCILLCWTNFQKKKVLLPNFIIIILLLVVAVVLK